MALNSSSIFENTMAACKDENNQIWFASNKGNLLYVLNIENKKIECVDYFDEEDISFLYVGSFYYKQKVFFIPANTTRIAVYDIAHRIKYYINIPYMDFQDFFNSVKITDTSILLFPSHPYKYSYIFDLENETLQHLCPKFNNYEEMDCNEILFGTAFNNSRFFYAHLGSYRFSSYNVSSNEIQDYTCYKNTPIRMVGNFEENIYTLSLEGNIFDLYSNDGKWIKRYSLKGHYKKGMQTEDGKLVLVPLCGCMICVIDNNGLKEVDFQGEYQSIGKENDWDVILSVENQDIYLLPYLSNYILFFDSEFNLKKKISTEIKYNELYKIEKSCFSGKVVQEGLFCLYDFLHIINS